MDAAAMPFPREETTPPVTKMNLAIRGAGSFRRPPDSLAAGPNQLPHAFQIGGRIHAEGLVIRFDHSDFESVFEGSQLLQALRLLQRSRRHTGISQEKFPPVNVKSDVFVINTGMLFVWLPRIWNRGAREVDGIFETVRHHLDDIGVGNFPLIFNPLLQCSHGDGALFEER